MNPFPLPFYLAFLLLALISPFLPQRLIGRSLALSFVALAAGWLLEGPTHWSEKGWEYAMGMAVLGLFALAVLVAIAIRVAVTAAMGWLSRGKSAQDERAFRALDRIILAAAGGVSGLALAIVLAYILSGVPGGRYLDIGIALSAFACACLATRYRILGPVPIASLCITIAAIATAGSGQPERIIRQAEALAAGRPWCFVGPSGTAPISSVSQLGFFSLPKGRPDPHLAVLIQNGGGMTGAHWSIRQQRLLKGLGTEVPSCRPRRDFAQALRNGLLDPDMFVVGSQSFSVPPALRPTIRPDRLSILNPMMKSSDEPRWPPLGRIEIAQKAPSIAMPAKTEALEIVRSLTSAEMEALAAVGGRTFVGTESGTARRAVLQCPNWVRTDRNCHAVVEDGGIFYSFYFPVAELVNWSESANRVSALLSTLRVKG